MALAAWSPEPCVLRYVLGCRLELGVVILDVVKRHQRNKSRQRLESLSSAGSETARKRTTSGTSRSSSRNGLTFGAAGSQRSLRPASSGVSEDIAETHGHSKTASNGRHSVSYAAGTSSPESVVRPKI